MIIKAPVIIIFNVALLACILSSACHVHLRIITGTVRCMLQTLQ